ncbi:MAG: lysylphosphatidylglycerol synthase transmembrane domain-containing protein [Chloroflexota bacterium]
MTLTRVVSRPLRLLPWLLAFALLYWVARTVSLADVWQLVQQLSPNEIFLLVLANVIVLTTLNGRWWLTLYGQGHTIPFWDLFRYRLAAFGLSYITPGPHFGGEPLQVYFVEKAHNVPRATAVSALTLDKLLELIVNFAFMLIGILLIVQWQTGLGGVEVVSPLVGITAVFLLALPLLLLLALWRGHQPLTTFFRLWQKLPLWQRLGWQAGYEQFLQTIADSETQVTQFCRRSPLILFAAFGCSLLSWLAMLAEYWLMLAFLGSPLTLIQLAVTLTAARIAILLLIPGAVGALEASQMVAFGAIGLNPAVGIGASLLIRMRDVGLAVLGLWWGWEQIRETNPSETSKALEQSRKVL